jgi:phosphoglycerate dehydrogenase-like enzyme
MIVGLCGAEFPDVRDLLARALPEAEFVIIDHGAVPGTSVDVLVPKGGVVGADLMDAAKPKLIQQFGIGLQGVDLEAAQDRGIPVRNVREADGGDQTAVANALAARFAASARAVIG